MGSGCSAFRFKLPEIPVRWFPPEGAESKQWQNKKHGFGQGRNKAFMKGLRSKSTLNRKGNESGQLGGRIIFYDKAIPKKTNYEAFSYKHANHVFSLSKGQKLFCKAFFKAPLGRMPIGENNIPRDRIDLKGQGPVLLAPCPKAIAIFVSVDGKPQRHEFFCEESAEFSEEFYEHVDIEPCPITLHRAVTNSFLTFMVSRAQDGYFFLHIPLIATFYDSFMDTGSYGTKSIQSFIHLFSSLSPGKHTLELTVRVFYDHCDYNFFPMDKNINARGLWYDGLHNSFLSLPHPDPQKYLEFSSAVAKGSCVIDIPVRFKAAVEGILDRKPPTNDYPRKDIEIITADAKIVAAGRYSGTKEFGVEGLPDVLILTSDRKERKHHHKDTGYRYRFENIDYAALWLNKKEQSDNAHGVMIEGAMARGEIRPRQMTKSWVWHPLKRGGEVVGSERLEVKNKYIRAYMQYQKERAEVAENINNQQNSKQNHVTFK